MQLKQEAGEDVHSRKRFHMISKLRRAVKHASNLESVIRSCDRVRFYYFINFGTSMIIKELGYLYVLTRLKKREKFGFILTEENEVDMIPLFICSR